MSKAITVIPTTMRTLMKANSAFNSANSIGVGPPYRVAKQFWPMIAVIMTGEDTDAQMTGNKYRRAYSGFVMVEAIIQDVITVTERAFTVSSFVTVAELASAVVEFFKDESQHDLGNPAIDNGAVDLIEVSADVEYPTSERDNTWYSAATIPFVVYTWETL